MGEFDNLSGREIGIWEVLEFDHLKYNGVNHRSGMSYYRCRCKKCGKEYIRARSELLQRPCNRHRGCEVDKNANTI